ncbi:MAG: HAD family phosphatase [Pirellulales bacterium]
MSLKFVYFDLGNVLFHFDHRRAAANLAAAGGVTPQAAWDALFASGMQWRYEQGELTTGDVCRLLNEALATSLDESTVAAAISDIFWLNDSIVPVVARLQAAGWPLGILSNTCHAHWEWINADRYPLIQQHFDHFVLSYEVGSMKPDQSIYAHAQRVAGCQADEIFFMDDVAANVAGALAAGWDAVLYESTPQLVEELARRGLMAPVGAPRHP